MDYENYSQILKCMGHPIRLRIVEMLLDDECCVTDVINMLDLPQSTVSQHIGILKNGGVLYPVKHGTKTCYRVHDGIPNEICSVLIKND